MPFENKVTSTVFTTALDRAEEIAASLQLGGKNNDTLRIISANEALCRKLKLPSHVVEGQNFDKFITPDIGAEALKRLVTAARAGKAVKVDVPCYTGVEGTVWIAFHMMPSTHLVGGTPLFALLGRDISAQRRAQDEQDAMQRMLVSVFVSVDAAVLILDEDGGIIMANPRSSGLLNSNHGLNGRSFADLLEEPGRQDFLEAHAEQKETGGPYSVLIKVTSADGQSRDLHLSAARVQARSDRRCHVLTLVDSIKIIEAVRVVEAERAAGSTGGILRAGGLRNSTGAAGGSGAGETQVLLAGKLRMIGFREVEPLFGDRWPAIKAHALTLAEDIISKSIGPRDEYFRSEDDSFIIVFAEDGGRDIEDEAERIGHLIRDTLLRAIDMPEISQITTVASKVHVTRDAAGTRDSLMAAVDQSLEKNAAEARAEAETFLTSAPSKAKLSPDLEVVYDRQVRQVSLWQVWIEESLRKQIDQAINALETSSGFDINGLNLDIAVDQAIDKAAKAGHALLFQLWFPPLVRRKTMESYIAKCKAAPESLRQRLIPMIKDFPPALGAQRYSDLYRLLAPLFKSAGIIVRDFSADLGDVTKTPWSIVAIEAHNLFRELKKGEKAFINFQRAVQSPKTRLMVLNIETEEDLNRIQALEFDLFTPTAPFRTETPAIFEKSALPLSGVAFTPAAVPRRR